MRWGSERGLRKAAGLWWRGVLLGGGESHSGRSDVSSDVDFDLPTTHKTRSITSQNTPPPPAAATWIGIY